MSNNSKPEYICLLYSVGVRCCFVVGTCHTQLEYPSKDILMLNVLTGSCIRYHLCRKASVKTTVSNTSNLIVNFVILKMDHTSLFWCLATIVMLYKHCLVRLRKNTF